MFSLLSVIAGVGMYCITLQFCESIGYSHVKHTHTHTHTFVTVVHIMLLELICFETWAKLAQQWLVCALLRIHLEPINKELILLVTI